ncbi:MAG: HAD family hydrolase [Nitrososphaerota archaeon]|jgi:phosphoglycolate phosphatase-like HAD superfamily hydrolase|nr:HAD family hydrolase [Nitrososphaerota archaeon]
MNSKNIIKLNRSWKGDVFKVAFFDFDGTLSLIREGWPEIMIPYFCELLELTPEGCTKSRNYISSIVEELVTINTGKQTIYQCIELSKCISDFKGDPCNPLLYKKEYVRRLNTHIAERLSVLKNNSESAIKYLIPGSIQMLSLLRQSGIKLFLASGTDEIDVKVEANLLGIDIYFDGIFGAKDDYESFSKSKCLHEIINNLNICGSEVIGFGDGFVEIEAIKQVGGFACGVASNEINPIQINPWKKKRLIDARADIIVPNFENSLDIITYIKEGV